jgi:hypothetical protein
MHTNTDLHWDQVRTLRPFLLETLSYKDFNRKEYNNNERDIKILDDVYDEYNDPIHIMTDKVFNSMKNYQNSYFNAPNIEYLSKPLPSLKKTNILF